MRSASLETAAVSGAGGGAASSLARRDSSLVRSGEALPIGPRQEMPGEGERDHADETAEQAGGEMGDEAFHLGDGGGRRRRDFALAGLGPGLKRLWLRLCRLRLDLGWRRRGLGGGGCRVVLRLLLRGLVIVAGEGRFQRSPRRAQRPTLRWRCPRWSGPAACPLRRSTRHRRKGLPSRLNLKSLRGFAPTRMPSRR